MSSLRVHPAVSRFLVDYGMLGVLALLGLYYSWATFEQQHPLGNDAARVLHRKLARSFDADANLLIAGKPYEDDVRFVEALAARLQQSRFRVVGKVNGSPVTIRRAIEQLASTGTPIDVIAAPTGSRLVLRNIKDHLPALSQTRILVPDDYWWPTFLKIDNLLSVANRVVVIAVIAVGMTMVIITGGIDLSVGSVLALSAVVTAWLIRGSSAGYEYRPTLSGGWLVLSLVLLLAGAAALASRRVVEGRVGRTIGWLALLASMAGLLRVLLPFACRFLLAVLEYFGPSPGGMTLCCLTAIGLCALIGGFSGSMVTVFRVPPFIATLAVMLIARGLALRITRSQSISGLPPSFDWLGLDADLLSIPNAVILMVIIYAAAQFVMSRTRFGRYIYAVGGNRQAARLSGIHVNRVLLLVYTICGAMAGLGGVIEASQFTSGDPKSGMMYELDVIAAVVVGGTSLAGGEGRILGTLIGAFIIAVIQNGMNLTEVEIYNQRIVLGFVILGAVLLDMLKKHGWRGLRAAE